MRLKHAVIIGSGNVASAIAAALVKNEIEIVEVISRNLLHAETLAKQVNAQKISSDFGKMSADADLYILSVSDDAIHTMAEAMPKVKGVVVHTSGVKGLDVLDKKFDRSAVWYPLQTFTRGKEVSFQDLPFLITSDNSEVKESLRELTLKLGGQYHEISEEQKMHVHVAAVLINNFVNYLVFLSENYAENYQIPKELFGPLLKETLSKALELGAENAQTGPARRGDLQTIQKHLNLIESFDKTVLLSLYQLFSKSILEHYQNVNPDITI